MHIDALDAQFQTALFVAFLVAAIVFTFKKDKNPHEMNHSHTQEIKGVAILMVLFSHIGYFLASDHRFLFPLSVGGGVGVDTFLFISGFGLTLSAVKMKRSVLSFYFKRLQTIFIPMWLVLVPTLLFDKIFFDRSYELPVIVNSFLGFFPNADIDSAINSPLWYFTLILFYYLVFPLVFWRKKPFVSAIVLLLIGFFVVKFELPVTSPVLKLYSLHYVAFPLGMLFASVDCGKLGLRLERGLVRIFKKPVATNIARYALLAVHAGAFGYLAINSGVGKGIFAEQSKSLAIMLLLVSIIIIKNIKSGFLELLGKYSYEIYLIQWPILYRHDFVYKYTPAFLGTILYILVFIVMSYYLQKLSKSIIAFVKSAMNREP